MSTKWSNLRCKSFNICCKVFQFCLTLLYTLGVIVLKCFPVSLKLLESSGVFRFSTYSRVRNNRPPPPSFYYFSKNFPTLSPQLFFNLYVIYEPKYSRMDQVKFLRFVFHKFYLVHSWILCPKYGQYYFSKMKDLLPPITREIIILNKYYKSSCAFWFDLIYC